MKLNLLCFPGRSKYKKLSFWRLKILARRQHKNAQLPHSYYFTTPILVLKFANKGVLFEEIQDSHFPRKRRYFGTHLREFGEKGVNFDVQCFTVKIGLKSQCFTTKKGGSFWTEKLVFYHEKGVLLS